VGVAPAIVQGEEGVTARIVHHRGDDGVANSDGARGRAGGSAATEDSAAYKTEGADQDHRARHPPRRAASCVCLVHPSYLIFSSMPDDRIGGAERANG